MSIIDARRPPSILPLLAAVVGYTVCLFAWTGLIAIGATSASRFDLPVYMLAIGYLALGLVMNRVVLRRLVRWHPMYATLAPVTNAKLLVWLTWPLAYPLIFLRMFIHWLL